MTGQTDAARQLDWRVRSDLTDGERKSGRRQPGAGRGGEAGHEVDRADGPEDVYRSRSRREKSMLPCEHQRGQVAVVVDVEVCQRNVRNRLPIRTAFGEPARDPAST